MSLNIDIPTTTILLIDNNDKDRTYYADRIRIGLPDCHVLESKDGSSGLELYKSHGSIASSPNSISPICPAMNCWSNWSHGRASLLSRLLCWHGRCGDPWTILPYNMEPKHT